MFARKQFGFGPAANVVDVSLVLNLLMIPITILITNGTTG